MFNTWERQLVETTKIIPELVLTRHKDGTVHMHYVENERLQEWVDEQKAGRI